MYTPNIVGERVVTLRCVLPEDLDIIYVWENDPMVWQFSRVATSYSLVELSDFIQHQNHNLDVDGQIRLMICLDDDVAIGALDIFEYDAASRSAGVGILIDFAQRGNGYATEALRLVEVYLIENFQLSSLWCHIAAQNIASLNLFRGCGYVDVSANGDEVLRFEKNLLVDSRSGV